MHTTSHPVEEEQIRHIIEHWTLSLCRRETPSARVATRDIKVAAGAQVSAAYWDFRVEDQATPGPATPAPHWRRATSIFEKRDGSWRMVHDEVSDPACLDSAPPAFTMGF